MSSPNLESGKARDRMLGAAMYEGRVRVFVSLGGNLALAAPDTPYTFEALQNCELILAGLAQATLTTVRSHDQFNTTIYSDDDRYRGLKGLRTAVFMNETDMRDRGLSESGIAGYSTQSGQPVTKHLEVEVTPSRPAGHGQ
jgi:anaerobic selenocysteine-containing dehydrogenase